MPTSATHPTSRRDDPELERHQRQLMTLRHRLDFYEILSFALPFGLFENRAARLRQELEACSSKPGATPSQKRII